MRAGTQEQGLSRNRPNFSLSNSLGSESSCESPFLYPEQDRSIIFACQVPTNLRQLYYSKNKSLMNDYQQYIKYKNLLQSERILSAIHRKFDYNLWGQILGFVPNRVLCPLLGSCCDYGVVS